jgi:hypothetical protein
LESIKLERPSKAAIGSFTMATFRVITSRGHHAGIGRAELARGYRFLLQLHERHQSPATLNQRII